MSDRTSGVVLGVVKLGERQHLMGYMRTGLTRDEADIAREAFEAGIAHGRWMANPINRLRVWWFSSVSAKTFTPKVAP